MVRKRGMFIPFAPTVYTLDRNKINNFSETKRLEIEIFIENNLSTMFNNVLSIIETHINELELIANTLYIEEHITYDDINKLLPNKENYYKIDNIL